MAKKQRAAPGANESRGNEKKCWTADQIHAAAEVVVP